jgi:hypothetical protein
LSAIYLFLISFCDLLSWNVRVFLCGRVSSISTVADLFCVLRPRQKTIFFGDYLASSSSNAALIAAWEKMIANGV